MLIVKTHVKEKEKIMLIETTKLSDKVKFHRNEKNLIEGYVSTKDILSCKKEDYIHRDKICSILGKLEECKDLSSKISDDLSTNDIVNFCFNKAMEIVRNETRQVE